MSTKIEWAQETWNPIIGCTKISEGCDNCYAEKMACRLANMRNKQVGIDYASVIAVNKEMKPKEWAGNTLYRYDQVTKPSQWKKARMIFVCSMGDLFHEHVNFEFINAVFSVMSDYDHHTYLVLTKRPERMKAFYNWQSEQHGVRWEAKSNVWIGVTVENQKQANKRIPFLLDIPAPTRFVSIEPMLGLIDLPWLRINWQCSGCRTLFAGAHNTVCPSCSKENYWCGSHKFNGRHMKNKYAQQGSGLDWVICGGETGNNARPIHPNWVKSLRDQCKDANVPFFFKGWGDWQPTHFGGMGNTSGKNEFNWCERGEKWQWMCKVGKQNSGYLLDGEKYFQFPKEMEVES